WLLSRLRPAMMRPAVADESGDERPPLIADDALHHEAPSLARTGKILGVGLTLWFTPVLAVALLTGVGSVFTTEGLFFSGTAVVTFGGAYAVLAFVAQRAVEVYGWLSAGDMVRGLSLAETTPGPLIMVLQFVGFLGAYHHPGELEPWLAGVIGALLTTWVTFVPSFMLVFLGAPSIERLRGNRSLSAALTAITAAVVGVIANLGVYFASHTLFAEVRLLDAGPLMLRLPDVSTARPVALGITVLAMVMVFALRWSVPRVLLGCASLGLAAGMLGLPLG
ncbi:MAG: chromate transporter, partial [Actinophytocola sp.]|nr:chromate transporter [Actinophytocola sp.]